MLLQTKNCRSALCLVTTYAFKNAGTVMQDVGHHMHTRVVPLYELAITPDFTCNLRSFCVFRLTIFREHVGHAPSGDTNGIRTLQRQFSITQNCSSRVMKL